MQTELLQQHGWPEALEQAQHLRQQRGRVAAFLWKTETVQPQDWSLLDAEEQRRAERFVRPEKRRRFLSAHAGLRRLLTACTATPPEALRFTRAGARQKPGMQPASSIRFSLSHSKDWAAVAIADGHEPGIDIEAVRPIASNLPQRYFSAQEQAALAQLSGAEWQEGCFRAWTRKEALLKAIGTGVTLPLHAFTVSLHPDAPAALLASTLDELRVEHWSLVNLDCIPGYCGALAVPRTVERVEITVMGDGAACK
jgi:4'-phosphopantetheinyl transferase